MKNASLWVPSLALMAAAPLALAQPAPQSEVTVQAHATITHKDVGRSYIGAPIEQITLTRRISYRDLNLSTPAGQRQLKERIDYVAHEACRQLSNLYPLALWTSSNAACVTTATNEALAQVPAAVASADQGQRRR